MWLSHAHSTGACKEAQPNAICCTCLSAYLQRVNNALKLLGPCIRFSFLPCPLLLRGLLLSCKFRVFVLRKLLAA